MDKLLLLRRDFSKTAGYKMMYKNQFSIYEQETFKSLKDPSYNSIKNIYSEMSLNKRS